MCRILLFAVPMVHCAVFCTVYNQAFDPPLLHLFDHFIGDDGWFHQEPPCKFVVM